MKLLHGRRPVIASFDDPNLVSYVGLVPVMHVAQVCGLREAVASRVNLGVSTGCNPAGKVATIVAGMLTGADCIDDLDVVRHGGMKSLFGGVYAPSTLGSFLRSFTHGHVRQLESASRAFLASLAATSLAAGRPLLAGADVLTFVDVDSLLRRVYGKSKQGAAFGHAKVGGYSVLLRGLSPLVATVSTKDSVPVIAATRLRGGNAGSARGAASLLTEAIATARTAGACGKIVVRADSAYYGGAFIAAARAKGARFSVTIRHDSKNDAAIAAIGEKGWTAIRYPHAVFVAEEGRWISDAEVAETTYTAFAGTKYEVTARLVVRRIKRLNPKSGDGQDELFTCWRYHAFFTDDPDTSTVAADLTHRAHAVVEQTFADLINGPLAHLPSGSFGANGAWLTCAAIAHNLTRAAGCLAEHGLGRARGATIRRRIINIAARVAHHARQIVLHLPEKWPWQDAWTNLNSALHPRPAPG